MTKRLTRTGSGWEKQHYRSAYRFDVAREEVNGIIELSELLTSIEDLPKTCVIRGRLIAGMPDTDVYRLLHDDKEKERPATFEEDPNGVRWIMLDFDNVPAPDGLSTSRDRLEYLVSMLPEPFHDASYHYQWSASAGLDGWDNISAHLWFWLTEPWRDSVLIERMDVEGWDVDESPIRTVQPNFTAAPIFIGAEDILAGQRSGLVRKSVDEVHLPPFYRPKPVLRFDGTKTPVKGKSFEERLNDIGPRFHMPINRAIACYVAQNGHATDHYELKNMINDALDRCGYAVAKTYRKDCYLENSIKGAKRKYGGAF